MMAYTSWNEMNATDLYLIDIFRRSWHSAPNTKIWSKLKFNPEFDEDGWPCRPKQELGCYIVVNWWFSGEKVWKCVECQHDGEALDNSTGVLIAPGFLWDSGPFEFESLIKKKQQHKNKQN